MMPYDMDFAPARRVLQSLSMRGGILMAMTAAGLLFCAAHHCSAQCYEFASAGNVSVSVNITNLPSPNLGSGTYVYNLQLVTGNTVTVTKGSSIYSLTPPFSEFEIGGESNTNPAFTSVGLVAENLVGSTLVAGAVTLFDNASDVLPTGWPPVTFPPLSDWNATATVQVQVNGVTFGPYTLTSISDCGIGTSPSVSSGGVVSASAFGEFTSVAPGSWIEIYGANLALGVQSWAVSDFNGVNAPTSLAGTSVSIGGQAAFIDFVSPGQVNALVPSNVATGTQPMTVTVGGVTSSALNVTVNPVQPGLDAPPLFKIGGVQYAVATFADGTFVLPEGAIAGLSSRAAQPGDEIVLYGVGFGPVTPNVPAGQLVQEANTLTSSLDMSIGGVPVTNMPYAGVSRAHTSSMS